MTQSLPFTGGANSQRTAVNLIPVFQKGENRLCQQQSRRYAGCIYRFSLFLYRMLEGPFSVSERPNQALILVVQFFYLDI